MSGLRDQDPHFRRKFYEQILGVFREAGTTVVAVCHDETYFRYSDRRIHFIDGRAKEVPVQSASMAS